MTLILEETHKNTNGNWIMCVSEIEKRRKGGIKGKAVRGFHETYETMKSIKSLLYFRRRIKLNQLFCSHWKPFKEKRSWKQDDLDNNLDDESDDDIVPSWVAEVCVVTITMYIIITRDSSSHWEVRGKKSEK